MDSDIENNEKQTQPRSSNMKDTDIHPAYGSQNMPESMEGLEPKPNALSSDETLSRLPTSDSVKTSPPPDGGFHAWFIAVLAHGVMFNTWGFINSFGLFQTYYVHNMNIGGESQVSWIGSLQIFIVFLVGAFSGRAFDAGYFRIMYITGSFLYVLGMFTLSLCTEYWQVFLAQCLCVGIGFGLVFVPTLALVSTYFSRNRGLALGLAATGNATGGLVFPAIAEQMLPSAGFPWTVRTMAFVMMGIAIVAGIFLKPRLPPRKTGPIVEWVAFKEPAYTLYLIGGFLLFWSVYIGYYFLATFGRVVIHVSQSTSISLILVMNGVQVPCRGITNTLADKVTGPVNIIIPIAAVNAVLLFSWIAVDSVTGLWIFAAAYGICVSSLQGLFPVVLANLTVDPRRVGVRVGMGFTFIGLATLTGPPIAGALVQAMNGSFLGVQVFSGISMTLSVVFLLATRWSKVGWKLKVKI